MNKIPQHIAFIADGNRRWAAGKGGYSVGYYAGYHALRRVSKAVFAAGVPVMSVFVFSTENWNRPIVQVKYLFSLFEKELRYEIEKAAAHKIRLRFIGDRSKFSSILRQLIERAENVTESFSEYTLVIALDYSGRDDIVYAVKKIARKIRNGEIGVDQIDAELLDSNLYTAGIPHPDLLVRTMEQRISNFMLWQSAYAEIRFLDKCWPDMTEDDVQSLLLSYSNTKRTHGR